MDPPPHATLVLPHGRFDLLRARRGGRFLLVGRPREFYLVLPGANPFFRAVQEALAGGLAGAVAGQLFLRASVAWTVPPDTGLSLGLDPAVEAIPDTPCLHEAASALAAALRGEIRCAAVEGEAGRLLARARGTTSRARRAIGLRGGEPGRFFGRLAILGTTDLGTVAPWLERPAQVAERAPGP